MIKLFYLSYMSYDHNIRHPDTKQLRLWNYCIFVTWRVSGLILYTLFVNCCHAWWLGSLANVSYRVLWIGISTPEKILAMTKGPAFIAFAVLLEQCIQVGPVGWIEGSLGLLLDFLEQSPVSVFLWLLDFVGCSLFTPGKSFDSHGHPRWVMANRGSLLHTVKHQVSW